MSVHSGSWIAAVAALALATSSAGAVSVERWSLSTVEEFARGKLDGTAIDAEGNVVLAPEHAVLWGPGEGIVWDVDPAGDGAAFVGLSSPGRVLLAREGRQPEVWHRAEDEGMVTAVAADGSNGVYAGLTPGGRVLHGSGPDEMETVVETGAAFVWTLARGRGGRLWIGTGAPGALLSWSPGDEAPTTVFETGDDPVRCLAPLADGGVAFGTGGKGRVVRIDERGRPFVILDADEEEIVALVESSDGGLWVLAASGPKQVARGQAAVPQSTGSVTTVRVVATPPGDETNGAPSQPTQAQPAAAPPRLAAPPGGAVYRVDPDGSWHRLWEAVSETPFGLALGPAGRPVVATGDTGRLWELDERGRAFALLRIASEQASAIARAADGRLLVGGTTDARVVRIGPAPRPSGSYLTPVIDAGGAARWGRADWRAEVPTGAGLAVLARAGNSAEPDETWTEWNDLGAEGSTGAQPELPSTRFLQLRLDLTPASDGRSPEVRVVESHWRPRNRPPSVTSITVDAPGTVWSRTPVQSARTAAPTVADDPVARRTSANPGGSTIAQAVRKSWELGARTVWWTADDPDGDALTYRLELRREGESRWLPLAADVEDTFYVWDARTLPDGLYRIRATSSDVRDNPDGEALNDQRVTSAFLVDNTRPSVGELHVEAGRRSYELRFVASDEGGRVAATEISVNGAEWRRVEPVDGVADSAREQYEVRIDRSPDSGAGAVRVRVVDSAGNVGGDLWSLD